MSARVEGEGVKSSKATVEVSVQHRELHGGRSRIRGFISGGRSERGRLQAFSLKN